MNAPLPTSPHHLRAHFTGTSHQQCVLFAGIPPHQYALCTCTSHRPAPRAHRARSQGTRQIKRPIVAPRHQGPDGNHKHGARLRDQPRTTSRQQRAMRHNSNRTQPWCDDRPVTNGRTVTTNTGATTLTAPDPAATPPPEATSFPHR